MFKKLESKNLRSDRIWKPLSKSSIVTVKLGKSLWESKSEAHSHKPVKAFPYFELVLLQNHVKETGVAKQAEDAGWDTLLFSSSLIWC